MAYRQPQSNTQIIQKGSSKQDLRKIIIRIFNECVRRNIKIMPTWIPREENKLADYFSNDERRIRDAN